MRRGSRCQVRSHDSVTNCISIQYLNFTCVRINKWLLLKFILRPKCNKCRLFVISLVIIWYSDTRAYTITSKQLPHPSPHIDSILPPCSYILKTPIPLPSPSQLNPRLASEEASTFLLEDIANPKPTTSLVSAGRMMPSSHNRAVA